MKTPRNKSGKRWIDAVVLVFAVSIGAAALNGTNHNKTSVTLPVPQPTQVIVVTAPVAPIQPLSVKAETPHNVLLMTPIVKVNLLKDETLYPSANPSLNRVDVYADDESKIIVLKGVVRTESMKKRAETIAERAVPNVTYTIDNQLTISSR